MCSIAKNSEFTSHGNQDVSENIYNLLCLSIIAKRCILLAINLSTMYLIYSKITIRLLFKICSIIFCTTGLIFQSSQLLNQYLSGRTYASIKIGQIFNDTLPAITVCSHNFFSPSKLAGFNGKLDSLYNKQNNVWHY